MPDQGPHAPLSCIELLDAKPMHVASTPGRDDKDLTLVERTSICLPHFGCNSTLHQGDDMFVQQVADHFSVIENNALEAVVRSKKDAAALSNDDYFVYMTEAMANILGADMTFIMKRVLVDEQDVAIEVPPFGEPGSCMMAAAFHYRKPDGSHQTLKESTFHAYSCPCAFMRHDKVFLIPEKFGEFITSNPNTLPVPAEAYIGVPIFLEGKNIGHFGCLWSIEAAAKRNLSWGFIEMIMHSLEDGITERLGQGATFIPQKSMLKERNRIIPHEAVPASQSLRPYAGSLSHELRTPMQGVVGMLDVMYATVLEAAETSTDPALQRLFDSLKDSIEVVQDSSRRAVEAADNVVHAYDMDMVVPERAIELGHDESAPVEPTSTNDDRRPDILISGSNFPIVRTNKRRSEDDLSRFEKSPRATKFRRLEGASSIWSQSPESYAKEKDASTEASRTTTEEVGDDDQATTAGTSISSYSYTSRGVAPGLRNTNMRDVFKRVIDEGLKLGGRPDTMLATEVMHGESVEVRSRGSDGTVSTKIIDWSVDPNVPETMFIDEKDLIKLISCVFLNALKFADQHDGRIGIHAGMKGRYIIITIKDNGPGIPSGFLPKLFKPFSQENRSITRQSDGLGLGLLVAKGIARKLGGDLSITRAETEGPEHGSEFAIKVPMMGGDSATRASSPFGSPRPRASTLSKVDVSQSFPPITDADQLASPTRLTAALHDAFEDVTSPYGPGVIFPTPGQESLTVPVAVRNMTSYPSSPPSPPAPIRQNQQPRVRKTSNTPKIDRDLAQKYPLNFLVAEDNKINRRLLVSMLNKMGYKSVKEAHDGSEAVRQMNQARRKGHQIDVVLMDLWMPLMDGYEATELILRDAPCESQTDNKPPTVLAVTADVTDGALARAAEVGMTGFMTKPYKMLDLQRLITEYCVRDHIAAH